MSFRYICREGFPLEILTPSATIPDSSFSLIKSRDYRGFYRKGESIGNFVFPENAMISSHAELYARYGLYENRSGLMGMGSPFVIEASRQLGEQYEVILSKMPVFMGDVCILSPNKKVRFVIGEYKEDVGLYESHILWGEMPSPLAGVGASDFSKALVDSMDEIKDAIVNFLSLCQSSPSGGKLILEGGQMSFELAMQQIRQKLAECQV